MKIDLKKTVFGLLVIISIIAFVYAWPATDTDGGFNPELLGTCSDDYGNYTDYCIDRATLLEYYPGNVTWHNDTVCLSTNVTCGGTCKWGRCLEIGI